MSKYYFRKYGSCNCKLMDLSVSFETCISCKWSRLNNGCLSTKEIDLQEIKARMRTHAHTLLNLIDFFAYYWGGGSDFERLKDSFPRRHAPCIFTIISNVIC